MLGGEEGAWEGVPPQPHRVGGGSVLSTEQTALLDRLRAGGRQPAADEEAPAGGGHDDSRPAAACVAGLDLSGCRSPRQSR